MSAINIVQRKYVLPIIAVFIFSFFFAGARKILSNKNKPAVIHPVTGNPFVVMELFTSQGCSSCPPADALLAEYASAQDMRIIPLSFHVDYWNRLGWVDPFSNKAFSERQQWYSQHLPKGSVYTPQLIVNGNGEAVGNNRNAVSQLVQKSLLVKPTGTIVVADISFEKNILNFRYKTDNAGEREILNIAIVQRQATTFIRAGENKGATLTNHNIVRSFVTQTANKEGTVSIDLPKTFSIADFSMVVYTQSKTDLTVTAAIYKDF